MLALLSRTETLAVEYDVVHAGFKYSFVYFECHVNREEISDRQAKTSEIFLARSHEHFLRAELWRLVKTLPDDDAQSEP